MDRSDFGANRVPAIVYDGRIGELYPIFLTNLLFTILTLGIFRFWAITRYRRYVWSRMRFQGHRFEYMGTGGELFVGFLLAGLVLIGMFIAAGVLAYGLSLIAKPLVIIPLGLLYITIIALALGAVFSAQRYRLSRTLWCGIRGGMTGSMVAYGFRALLYGLVAVVSLLQLVPWMQIRLAERRINASQFGTARFSFHGRALAVYGPYVLTLVGTILLGAVVFGVAGAVIYASTPGILTAPPDAAVKSPLFALVLVAAVFLFGLLSALLTCWYTALFERHVVGNTALGPVHCSSSMTGAGLLGLIFGNILIAAFTLGLGYPIVIHRNARFLASTLWVDGAVDPASLGQTTLTTPAFGEGMFQQLDGAGGWL